MTRRKTASKPVSPPHTSAWLAFEQNLDTVMHVLALQGREASALTTSTTRMAASIRRSLASLAVKGDSRQQAAVVANMKRTVDKYGKVAKTSAERIVFVNPWVVVMIVTCVEAYLQDVLSSAAGVDPEFMAFSEQAAKYAEIVAADSLEELAKALRVRWAKAWVNDGGPTRWIDRLTKMGAKGYPADLAARLELMWGIRHVVVHAAGVATADFARRHPGVVVGGGERVRVRQDRLKAFTVAMSDFTTPTEEYFLSRCPSLATVTTLWNE